MSDEVSPAKLEEVELRTDIANRKKVQTAEGWRRTMQKVRSSKRKKAAKPAK